MKAGDVLLFSRTSFSFPTWLIQSMTHSRWNHAAIAVGPTQYVEATAAGVVESAYSSGGDFIEVVTPPYRSDDTRLTAVAWAVARKGERYGYLNAAICGINNVLVGLGFVIKQTDSIICSELVAEALERAGMDFGKDSCLVSPGDLAEALGASR